MEHARGLAGRGRGKLRFAAASVENSALTPSRALVRAGVHGADRRLAPRIAAGCAWLGVQFMAYASRGLRLHGGPAFRRKEMNSQLSDGLVGTRRRSVELASRSASGGRSSGDACCGSQLRAGDRRRHDMCASRDGPALRRATPCRGHRTHGAHAAQLQKW